MSDYMPEELVLQILRRLPVKSLMRFRCVSKSWNSIISSSQFISMHTQQTILSKSSLPPQKFLIRHYSRALKKEVYSVHLDNEGLTVDNDNRIEFPFHNLSRFYFRIVGSCNGVVCLSDDLFGYTNTISLWNPSIRRKLILPMPHANLNHPGPYLLALGFGYDTKNLDFKVVTIAYVQGDNGYVLPPRVEIYALSTGDWREISSENVPQKCILEYFYTQAFVKGKANWIAYKKGEGSDRKLENSIMVFDLSDEAFAEMFLPNCLANASPINMCSLRVWGEETLALLLYDTRVWNKACSVWVMKEYGVAESWTKQFNVVVDGGLGMVLGIRNTGDVLLTAAANGELLSYDTVRLMCVRMGIFGTKDSFSVNAYIESLALLNQGKVANGRLGNDSDSDSSDDYDDDDDDDDAVEKHELWMQSIMYQFLTALLEH